MNKVSWIIEDDLFDDSNQRIADELQKLGVEYQFVKYTMAGFHGWKPYFDYKSPCIYRGSIQGCRAIQWEHDNLIPGPICNWDVYSCSYYYPKFKYHLLNSPFIMVPYGSLLEPNQMELMFQALGQENAIFVRPDSGFKSFTGKLVYKENFAKDVENFGYGDMPHDKMVLLSAPVNIQIEERLIIYRGEVISGSRYRQFGQQNSSPEITPYSKKYAESVIRDINWEPESLWVMDLAHTKNDIKVLEIGAFSVAGLYNCDVAPIVKAANQLALDLWKDYHD